MTAPVVAERPETGLGEAVAAALDIATMQRRLRALLPSTGTRPMGPTLVSAQPITLKPRRRILIEYVLARGPRESRVRVFGKLFPDRSRAVRLHRTWRGLEGVDFGAGAGVPRLLGRIDSLGLVVYLPAPGRTLADDLFSHHADAAVRRTGEWLARLHAGRVVLDRRLDLAREVENARLWAEQTAAAHPSVASRARRLGDELAACAGAIRPETDVPVHKDLHPGHVVVGPRLAVIDFDEMRLGDRSADMAHFCVYLQLAEMRHGPCGQIERLRRAFLAEYSTCTGWTPDMRFEFFSAYTWLKVARQLTRGSGMAPHPTGLERTRQLRAAVDRGHAAIRELM